MRLTFDDGPSVHTEELLPILRVAGVKATFFMVGENVERHPELAHRVYQDGHRIGNHSHTHPPLTSLEHEAIRDELRRCNEALGRAGVPSPTVCRPPYGDTADEVRRVIEMEGMKQVLWDVDPRDWEGDVSTEAILERIAKQLPEAPANPVVLLHDGRGVRSATVEAVRLLLDEKR
ncbi:MAG: polysaccharide deacetylase family protein [Actinomycetota bacterium]|nr:polysaccharide deacetylase family protein [Actinomycetota bacterium]